MSNRFKRALVLLSMGGVTLTLGGIGGLTCHPFAQSGPYVGFLSDSGQAAIDVGFNTVFAAANADVKAVLITPTADLFKNLWSGWVGYQFPQDPTFNKLLVE